MNRKIRNFVGGVSRAEAEQKKSRDWIRLISGAARLGRAAPDELVRRTTGMGRILGIETAELARWADPEDLPTGPSITLTRFDVCDLRIWLDLAETAGIDAIPARTIASFSEDELGVLVGSMEIPVSVRDRILQGLSDGAKNGLDEKTFRDIARLSADLLSVTDQTEEGRSIGIKAYTRMESALDDIPSDWMVRTHLAGSGNLKALVGCGLMEQGDETAEIRPGLEIGAGWIRTGNRRMIDISDPRFLETAVGGHKPNVHYLARPWARAGRFHEGEDLHRANTPMAGPGRWPAEWRVFVRAGQVTGVANYYGWTGDGATAENAWNAIEAAAAAQVIIDTAENCGLAGVFMSQVFIRDSGKDREMIERLDRDWPEHRMHCTLDFMETDEGLKFLEGGPAHQPGGGGHPCAFAGQNIDDPSGRAGADCRGVAYKAMPHVHLGEPETWVNGDATGCIENWTDAAHRACDYDNLSNRARKFLDRLGVEFEQKGYFDPDF